MFGPCFFQKKSLDKKSGKVGQILMSIPINTRAHLPYIAVLNSVHRTATVCNSIRTFFRGTKLLTVAVLWTLAKTSNCGSSMDTFRSFQKVQFCDRISTTPKSVHKTAIVCSFRSQLRKVTIELPPFAVLYHAKSSRCMATMDLNCEKCP